MRGDRRGSLVRGALHASVAGRGAWIRVLACTTDPRLDSATMPGPVSPAGRPEAPASSCVKAAPGGEGQTCVERPPRCGRRGRTRRRPRTPSAAPSGSWPRAWPSWTPRWTPRAAGAPRRRTPSCWPRTRRSSRRRAASPPPAQALAAQAPASPHCMHHAVLANGWLVVCCAQGREAAPGAAACWPGEQA